MKRMSVIAFLFWSMFLVAPAFAYTGSADFPDLFKYSDQKNTNLETALQSISSSFNEQEVKVTQELLAAIMATLVKEVEVHDFLPKEEIWDYGMGTGCSNPNGCKNDGIGHYEGGVDYKGRGYIQLTLKSNYEKYCPDCVGTSTPELDVCGCKNQMYCTVTDAAICPQVKALQQKRAANIFASYYIKSPQGKDLVSLSNAKSYKAVGKAINGGDAYASDFNTKANAYLKLFSDNPDKTNRLLIWLNSGATIEEATQKEVTLTLYVHDGSKDGPIIPNAQVTRHDASDNSFQQTTDSNGYVTITGVPGTWSFSVSADGYETNNWDQKITETDTKDAYLMKSVAATTTPPAEAEVKAAQESISDTLVKTLEDQYPVLSVAFSPDGQTIASGSSDSTIKLWDVKSGELIRTFEENSMRRENLQFQENSIAFSPEGRTLASGSHDGSIKLWDVESGKLTRTLGDFTGPGVISVAFSPDGQTIASGIVNEGTINLWDVKSGELIRTLKGNTYDVHSVAFSPDGRTLASGNWGATIKLWDVKSGELIRTLKGHIDFVQSVAFSPDGRTLASGSYDDTIKLWDVESGKLIRTLGGDITELSVISVAFSPDGQTIASGILGKGTIELWDVKSGDFIRTLGTTLGGLNSIAFSPDGQTIASGNSDSTIKLWAVSPANT